jgi:DNA-binding transcriptional LysR family regulator
MIKPELLKLYCEVIESKNITNSAKKMGISQPRASKMLQQIDDTLGFDSFKRIKRRLHPTEEGMLFYQHAKETISSLEQLGNKAKEIKEADNNKIVISAMPSVANGFLVEVIAEFKQIHPNAKVQLILENSPTTIKEVKKGTVDIGIAMRAQHSTAYQLQQVRTNKVAIIPTSHPLKTNTTISCQQLSDSPFVYIGLASMEKIYDDDIFSYFDKIPTITLHTSAHTVGCHFVANNLGCAIVDPYTAKSNEKLGYTIKKLKETIPFNFSILTPSNIGSSKIKIAFFNLLTKKCSDIQQTTP